MREIATSLSRRSLLAGMGRLSVLAAAGSYLPLLTGCSDDPVPVTLNVVLHGLFILNFTNRNIELFTPFMQEHVYLAGNWQWNELVQLKGHQEYELRGVKAAAEAPQVAQRINIAISHSQHNYVFRPEYSFLKVNLPFPQQISLARPVRGLPNTYAPGTSEYVINELSLCQVLSYEVHDKDALKLTHTDWSPDVNKETATVNLHIWAEPPLRLPYGHAHKGYRKLSEMLAPLKLTLATENTEALELDTNVYGLPSEQEQGLSEWISGGEGSHPTNCSTVMLEAKIAPSGAER